MCKWSNLVEGLLELALYDTISLPVATWSLQCTLEVKKMITQVCILSLYLAHRFKSFIVWNVRLDNLTYLWSVLSREVKSLSFQRTTIWPYFGKKMQWETNILTPDVCQFKRSICKSRKLQFVIKLLKWKIVLLHN